jgi:transposase-like protein
LNLKGLYQSIGEYALDNTTIFAYNCYIMVNNNETGRDLTLLTVTQRFSTEEAAIQYFEAIRWPDGRFCPHCGNADQKRIYPLTANKKSKIRPGLYKCAECRDTFTVRVGTVMEDSHVPLHKWLIGFYMMCASKTQISALQLQRQLEIGSYKTALFLCHRIRFALMDMFPLSKLGGTIEADETYIGGKTRGKGRAYKGNKTPVVSLIERGGRVRSRVVDMVTGQALTRDDFKQAARCLAFEIPTACAFHVCRGTEALIIQYCECLIGQQWTEKRKDWGRYIEVLVEKNAPDKITSRLREIAKMDRNAYVHPDVTVTIDEAPLLFDLCAAVIFYMGQELERLTP